MALQRSKGSKGDLDPASKFKESGQIFKAKLYGILLVQEARGDEIIQTALSKFRQDTKSSKDHKRKIFIRITLDGVALEDAATKEVIAQHPVRQISFLARDKNDTRAFGYIVSRDDHTFNLYGIKTEGKADVPLLAIKDMFDIVFQQETLLQRVQGGSSADGTGHSGSNGLSQTSSQSDQPYGAVGSTPTYQRNKSQLSPNAPPDEDDELAAAIALSIATAEQEKQERDVINRSILNQTAVSNDDGTQLTSPVEEDEDQPPPYDKLNIASGYELSMDESPPTIEELEQRGQLLEQHEQQPMVSLTTGSGENDGYANTVTLDERATDAPESQAPDEPNEPSELWQHSMDNAWGNVEWPSGSTVPTTEDPFQDSVWSDQPAGATNDFTWPDTTATVNTTNSDDVWGFSNNDMNTIDDQVNGLTLNIAVESPAETKEINIQADVPPASQEIEITEGDGNKLTVADTFDPFTETTPKISELEVEDSHDPWAQAGGFEFEETNKMDDAFADNPFEINISSTKKNRKSGSFSSTSSIPRTHSPRADTLPSRGDAASSHSVIERDRPASKVSNRSVSPFESDPFFTQPSPTKLPGLSRKSKPSEPSIPEAVNAEPPENQTCNTTAEHISSAVTQVTDAKDSERVPAFDLWASADPFAETKFEPFPIATKTQDTNDSFAPRSTDVCFGQSSSVHTGIDPFAADNDPFLSNQSVDPFGSVESGAALKPTDPFSIKNPYDALDPAPATDFTLPDIISNDPFSISNEPFKSNDSFHFRTTNIAIDADMDENERTINNIDVGTSLQPAGNTDVTEPEKSPSVNSTMQAASQDTPVFKIQTQTTEPDSKPPEVGSNRSNSNKAILEGEIELSKVVDSPLTVQAQPSLNNQVSIKNTSDSTYPNNCNDIMPTDVMTQSLEDALMSPPPSAPAPALSLPADTPISSSPNTITPAITVFDSEEPQTKISPSLPSRKTSTEIETVSEDLPPPTIPAPVLKTKAKAPPPIPARQKAPGRTTPAIPDRQTSIPMIPPRPNSSAKLS